MPRFDSDGSFHGFIGSCIDITDRKRLEWEQSLLLDASRLLSSSLDFEETLQHIARPAIGPLADVCLVDVVGDDSPARGVAVAHRDADVEERLRTIRRQHPPSPERLDPMVRSVLLEGRPVVVNDLPAEVLRGTFRTPQIQEVSLDILPRHLLCVPLHVRGETIGAISFGATTRGRYRRSDVVLAEELARRCASAIDNARLFRDVQRRADLLSDISAASRAFAEASLDPDVLLETIARRIGTLTGDACIIRLMTDDDVPDTVAVWHPDPTAAEFLHQSVTGPGSEPRERMPGTVLRTGEPIFLTAEAGEDIRSQVSAFFRPYVERYHVTTLFVLPLTVRGRTIGTLTLAREGDRPAYSTLERAFRYSLADRAAVSIDNALHLAGERTARAEAEAANRAKDDFLSVLSHELRTPLTPIIGLTQLLLRRGDLRPDLADALSTIDRNARMQARLVEDLLDVSRIVSGRLSIDEVPVDLRAVARTALDAVRSLADEKRIELVLTVDDTVPTVMGDPHRLQQIVGNLLSNAIKFTPAEGTVTTSVDTDNGMARLTVTDTGIGIEADFLPRVFDRFRQADASSTRGYAGLGLGLSIVRHLVDLHRGEVRVASEGRGRGATFTVLLPAASRTDLDGPPSEGTDAASLAGVRVLVVEDDSDTRNLLHLTLGMAGAEVALAATVKEALERLPEFRPTLILADIGLPGEDGYSMLARIRRLPPESGGDTPAVALTAYAGGEARRRALAAGFQEHLTKPIDPDHLVAMLAALVPGNRADAAHRR